MSIESLLRRTNKQTAVYWGNPQNDGTGGMTFAEPVEILCRWEDSSQVMVDNKGNNITSRGAIYVTQDLDEEGMLYLGTLDELDSDVDPATVQGAWVIKRFEKVPSLGSTTDFLRKAYLTPSLSFGGF